MFCALLNSSKNLIRIILKHGIFITAIVGVSTHVYASDIIRCYGRDDEIVTIILNSHTLFNHKLNCIEGNFIEDMTPCAPNNGYGLSYPTGSVKLSKIVFRWQDYGDHLGGVASSNIDETTIAFSGGFMSPSGYNDLWDFGIDRITGHGKLTLYTRENQKTANKKTSDYNCKKVKKAL